jgi:hypothetical protein
VTRLVLRLFLGLSALVPAVGTAAAQQTGTGAQETASAQQVDSAALRLRQRLRALGLPPGTLPDSAAADSARASRGSGAAAETMTQGDSVLVALMSMVEYDVTSYEARRAEYEAEFGELLLYGDSARPASLLQPDGARLVADSIIQYSQDTGKGEALGNPIYSPATGGPVPSQRLVFDTRRKAGSAYDARTRYAMMGGANWNVQGDLPLVAEDLVYGSHTRFTSCDLAEPHYHFEAGQVKILGGVMVARPVTLYFGGVPVAWLPFIAQSTGSGRTSGLLPVRFSVNDIVRANAGYRRRISNVGFFWAASEYWDATVALDWFDDSYAAITGSLRYRWLRQFLDGSTSVRRYWRQSGRTELSLDTRNSWAISERTKFSMAGSYASSTDFVRQNSFDPAEVTQQIRSQGGINHRFDWGTLALSASRSQSLSDDKIDMTLPTLNLSLKPITLFSAPPTAASWYNNMTWNGGFSFARRSTDHPDPDPEVGFSLSTADVANVDAKANSGLALGRFSLGQSMSLTRKSTFSVPDTLLPGFQPPDPEEGLKAFNTPEGRAYLALVAGEDVPLHDIGTTDLTWSTSLSYQQPLIGTTTFTPSLSLSGQSRKVDTVDVAQSFVAGPTRLDLSATLKADLYGIYPGVAGYEAIRHKVSPSFSYGYSPEVEPSDLQRRVFDAGTLQARSVMTVSLNQTWEAKRPARERTGSGADDEEEPPVDPVDPVPADSSMVLPPDSLQTDTLALGPPADPLEGLGAPGEELTRREAGEIVNLLSIRTSAVRYNFVESDETGTFIGGFETTSLSNQISSDFLRGLTISMSHDLFEEEVIAGEDGSSSTNRSFAPHLQSLNFGFALNQNSSIFRLFRFLDLGGDEGTPAAEEPEDPYAGDPFSDEASRSSTDEAAIVPGTRSDDAVRRSRTPTGRQGWQANLRYALNRPRAGGSRVSQTLQARVSLKPTHHWEMSWNTAYDLERGNFNDHVIRLTRDLHRWQAHFDFRQTATGNWSFSFEVSLLDNQDLHFDYKQDSLDQFGRR